MFKLWIIIIYLFLLLVFFVFRASQGEKADTTFDSQVVQYEPAHQGSINTVTNLSPDLCVSGGSDQVNQSMDL